jgi:hypothetical protein
MFALAFFLAYLLAPLFAICVVGVVAGAIVSTVADGRGAADFGRRMAVLVAVSAAAAVVISIFLPRRDVNGPVGATCPDLSSSAGHILAVVAVTSAVAAAGVVAAAVVELARRRQTAGTLGRFVVAAVVPYVAIGAWVIPAFCDYS